MSYTAEELITKIMEEKGEIRDVFLAACGGSLVDLYPGYYFINAESETMHSHWLTARQITQSPSNALESPGFFTQMAKFSTLWEGIPFSTR